MLNRSRALAIVAPWCLALACCTPMTRPTAAPTRGGPEGGRPLPSYSGHELELFDDGIEPRALGLDLDQVTTPKTDPRFRERAQRADIVARARVGTVTGKVEGNDASYQIAFEVVETIAGRHPLANPIVVRLDRSSASIGVMRSFEGRLVGKTMIVLARAFVRPDGDEEIHVHVVADTKDVLAAVHEAVILNEMGSAPSASSTTTTNSP